MAFEELGCRTWRRLFSDPAQGDVRVKDPDIEWESGRQQSVIDLLPQLSEARVTRFNADPNHPGCSPRRKGTDAGQGQQERLDLHAGEC